ncbi:uncharacterized protein LOC119497753 isoform X3 [Sebastes umbrosus]|uniref:uncharacterized protein LOC119497753 isoform X3 n=1 Tax=Sebastes umbrosus TaxID=72105 RepID=UPI00189F39FC|nr:uncharacterized protein LOC119497753 isoform X3 [Sebastes umbrosus]
MAEAARPSAVSSGVATMAEEKQHPSLIQRVETMASVIELLLETLEDLSNKELRRFKETLSKTHFDRRSKNLRWQLEMKDMQNTVFLMVLTDGQQSVEKTKEVLKTMKRPDLVQRLSDSSSGPKKKHSVDEHLSALIHKVATMRAVKELLMETLNDLSSEELTQFRWLLYFTFFQRNLPFISWSQLLKSTRTDLVKMMVQKMMEMYGHQSVEVTEEIFMDMNRTDLVQRLSEISSGPKEKHCVDEHWPALTQEVETMASVIELLLETLKDLSDEELERFKVVLRKTDFPRRYIPWWQLEITDMQDVVFLMVLTDGQQSVERTKEILKTMKRTDLVQRLSDSSSGPKKKHSDEHRPALIQKVATIAAVKNLLLKTLKHLSNEEIKKFNEFLQSIVSQKNLRDISLTFRLTSDRAAMVDQLVQTYGQQSVELTGEVLQKMNKTDLMQMLSKPSSGLKEKQSVDEHQPAVSETHDYRKTGPIFMKLGKLSWYRPKTQEKALSAEVVTTPSALTVVTEAVKQILLETLKDFSNEELKKFKRLLQFTFFKKSLPYFPFEVLNLANSANALMDLMVKTCGQQSVEVTWEVLMDMNRTDLVERLSEISSGLKEKHPSKPIQKEGTMTPVQEKLLETLKDLSDGELEKFKRVLQYIKMEKSLPIIPRRRMEMADRVGIVELMVQTYGQQSVEVTREVFKKIDRRDLVERLSDISSGSKEKQHPSLIQRVETMASVVELLLETLKDLSDKELEMFKDALRQTYFAKRYILRRQLDMKDMQDTVFSMVLTDGQQSVEKTKEVLKTMKRPDLVRRLSDSSSGPTKKHSVDEHLSALIHKVATMTAVKELLMETLNDLSIEELQKFKWLLQFTFFQRNLPLTSWSQLLESTQAYLVEMMAEMMVEMYGHQSVEVTEEIFMDMNRTDLVQRLSEISSGPKEKHCVDEHWPALTQEVETMASVIELLLETLEDLSDEELERFKVVLRETYFVRRYIPWWHLEIKDMQDTVFLMVRTEGQRSVEKTKEVLKTMKRTDLVQRLSDSSSGPKKKHSDEHRPALIQKVATIAAVRYLLLKTLKHLSYEEIWKFNEFLQSIVSQKNLPDISSMFSFTSDRAETVDQLVQTYGQQSVELTREVLQKMNKTDLMQMLSKPSSGLKEKQSVDEHQPAVSERHDYRKTGRIFMKLGKLLWYGPKTQEKALSAEVVTTPSALTVVTEAVKQILLETLKDLSNEELKKFKRMLQFTFFKKSLPYIQWDVLYVADSADKLVDYMVKTYGQQSVETTREVLMEMNRTDLVERLSETSSGLKGPSRSLEPEAGGSVMQDSSDWTKLEPEVNSPDADESPTYSLQSEAGNFECGVSGLRWVCKQKVSFKYQFCSWEEPMQRMESIQYMAAGPLIDIKVIAGKLDEVYLPHWICIHDNPTLLDKFAVLHIDDCGDVVEKVSEVTSSHVKLSEPVFSLKAVLVEVGIWKINCNVLIYKSDTAFLTLHVYVIPRDPGLEQEMDERKLSNGYKVIHKPHPEKSLRMRDRFILTADSDDAEIIPENLKLRYESRIPNFFEVYIENPDSNFVLELKQKDEPQPVWTRTIRKDEYQSTVGPTQVTRLLKSPHSERVAGSNPAWGPSVWSLHVLPVLAWVLSGFSGFLPESKDMQGSTLWINTGVL